MKSTYELKSGLISGCSAQHCRMILIASGGAAPFDTDGRISGGGFLIFDIISSADNESIQYGSPRTTTSCIIIPNEYTSPACVPFLQCPFELRNNSGADHNNSICDGEIRRFFYLEKVITTWMEYIRFAVFCGSGTP